MNFEVIHVSRGDIKLRTENKTVRVLGEALISSTPTEPSYVIYLNSLDKWEAPLNGSLNEAEKREVISAIQKYFHDRGSVVEFE